jgi:YidC/Oxa1 family membrane protein insertase
MERRVLLALFLSFLVFYIYQGLMPKPTPAVPAKSAAATSSGAQTAAAGAAQSAKGPAGVPAPPAQAAPPAPSATTVVGDTAEHTVTFETAKVVAVFTNRGARLESWRLKDYRNQETGQPLDLVAHELEATHPLPFSLLTPDAAVTKTLNTALYRVTHESHAPGQPDAVTFEYSDSAGIQVTKTFTMIPGSYRVSFADDVSVGGKPVAPQVQWGPGLADQGSETSRFHLKPEGLVFIGDNVQRYSSSAVAKQAAHDGDYKFAGIEDHYFMAVALDPGQSTISYQAVSIPPPPNTKGSSRDLMAYTLAPGKSGQPVTFFIGPKEFDVLAALNPAFVKAINYGLFAVIVVPLLRSLVWINGYVGNFGWSIVLLTILINALMFPLRHKSVVSMRKMQEIQPEAKAIQDRYAKLKATDPAKQKMNQELMDLYRQRGVNPLSGCLPMLLMMPVLYAFYSLLNTSIQLRGAPFIFWIHDLSAADPLYITPILMGVSQVWQQRLTPQMGADPTQQKMMMFMPVVFTVLFLWAPSGLAIYWLVNNVWTIGQQYLTNYLIGPPKVHNVRPPAERRVKRAGSGKTEAAARES